MEKTAKMAKTDNKGYPVLLELQGKMVKMAHLVHRDNLENTVKTDKLGRLAHKDPLDREVRQALLELQGKQDQVFLSFILYNCSS